MITTKTKTINFKVEDIASTNKIMGQRGTLLEMIYTARKILSMLAAFFGTKIPRFGISQSTSNKQLKYNI